MFRTTENSEINYAQGFHYVVRRNGKTVADIIGTMHDGESTHNSLNPTIEKASRKASRIAFENGVFQGLVITKDYVSSYKSRADAHKEYGSFHAEHYDEKKTYTYPSTTQETDVCERYSEHGTERLILKKLGENPDATIISLETADEYARSLYYCELRDDVVLYHQSSGKMSPKEIKALNRDICDSQRNGNESLAKQTTKWHKYHDPAFHYYINKKRNCIFSVRSVPLIEESSPDDRVLIAIGAAHLFGKNGVLNLFREMLGDSYSVEKYDKILNSDGVSKEEMLSSSDSKINKERYEPQEYAKTGALYDHFNNLIQNKKFEQAVEIAITIPDKQERVLALREIGKASIQNRKSEREIKIATTNNLRDSVTAFIQNGELKQAAEIANTIPDEQNRALAFREIGNAFLQGGKLKQEIENANTISDDELDSDLFSDIVKVFLQSGEFEQATKIANTILDEGKRVEALHDIVLAFIRNGEFEQAIKILNTIPGPSIFFMELREDIFRQIVNALSRNEEAAQEARIAYDIADEEKRIQVLLEIAKKIKIS